MPTTTKRLASTSASLVSASSRTPIKRNRTSAGWLAHSRVHPERPCSWRAPLHRGIHRQSSWRARFFFFCKPTISSATTAGWFPRMLHSFGRRARRPMAPWPCSRICMATDAICCNTTTVHPEHLPPPGARRSLCFCRGGHHSSCLASSTRRRAEWPKQSGSEQSGHSGCPLPDFRLAFA